MANVVEFFYSVREARFNLRMLWEWVVSTFNSMTETPDIQGVWNGLMTFVAPIYTSFIWILVVACLLSAFFGRKIMGAVRFCVFFIIGFFAGIYFLAPILPAKIGIPAVVAGLVIALIAAILSKFLYTLVYVFFFGYGAYSTLLSLLLLNPTAAYSNTKAILCLAVSVVVVILALVFRKYIEMALTSFFGALGAAVLVDANVYKFTALSLFGANARFALIIVAGVVALLALFVQVKTRRLY